jgi:hypothetical protein
MTKQNPFDLAIFALKRERDKAVIDDPCPICSYDSAIRLLEAAGRVDKWAIDFFLCEAIEPREYEISSQDLPSKYAVGKRGVEILISALPEE